MNTPGARFAFVNGGLGIGGTTTLLCNLGGELVRRGVPALVASLEHGNPLGTDFETAGVPVINQDQRKLIFEDRARSTLKALADFRPTAVVAGLGAGSYEILRYLPRGVTRVLMVQADDPSHYDPAIPYGGCVDSVVGVSERMRETLAAMPAFRGVPIHYLTSGVALPQNFKPRRPSPGSPVRILYLGRLVRLQKRVHLFPEILSGLVKSGIPFVWSIAGEGPEAEFLAQNMRVNRPDHIVRLLGSVPYRTVLDLLQQHDILLLASDHEGLPLSVLEGMAHGLVPVVSDLPSGIRELLDDSNGRRVPINDTQGYAEAVIKLYRNPDEMNRLSCNAHDTVRREYSTSVMADRWLSIFPPGPEAQWPTEWSIRPPLVMNNPFYFSPPARWLRRLGLRVRRWRTPVRSPG